MVKGTPSTWTIPLEVGMSIGHNWGEMIDVKIVDGKFVPLKEWKPEGTKEEKVEVESVVEEDEIFV